MRDRMGVAFITIENLGKGCVVQAMSTMNCTNEWRLQENERSELTKGRGSVEKRRRKRER